MQTEIQMKKILCVVFTFTALFAVKAQILNPMEKMIPMRDGKFLSADCHMADTTGATQYQVILIQTPYNKLLYRFNLPLGFGTNLAACPYAFVIVDWRGFYGSAAAAIAQPNRGEDGYDVIEWISQQAWFGGRVGTWGPSALGRVQYMTAREQHPSHTCAAPLVAAPQYSYTEYFQGGVYRTEYVEQLDNLGYGMSSLLLANPYYNTLWAYSESTTFYPAEIEIPLFMVAGWYDHNIKVMLEFFDGLQSQAPLSVRYKHKLLIGPWAHGGFGTAQVGTGQQGELFFPEAAGWSDSLALKFLDFYLRDVPNNWDSEPIINYFMPGPMTWIAASEWPDQVLTPVNLYFHDDGSLQTVAPSSSNTYRHYLYDPADPSPTIGSMTLRQDLLQGPYDQAPVVESRNDIIVFSTEELSQAVTVEGRIKIVLFVSSDRPDTDFAVRLTDVYPDQRSIILRDDILRARFREGYTVNDTLFMQAGQVYELEINLFDIAHTFMPGHKIRIDISSSNYPRFDNNLNNGGDMYTAGDTLIASNTIWCSAQYPSRALIPMSNFPAQIGENDMNEHFRMFPNPCSSSLMIEYSDNTLVNAELTDVNGKILKAFSFNGHVVIDVSDQPQGIYVLKIRNQNEIISKPLIISR
jgi:uncharacterized protein